MTDNKDELLDAMLEDDRRAINDPEYALTRAKARYEQAAEKLHMLTRAHVVNEFRNAGEFMRNLRKHGEYVTEAFHNVQSALEVLNKKNNGDWYPGFESPPGKEVTR